MSRSLKETTIEKKLTTGIILVCLFAALVAAAANYHFARQYLLQAVEKGQGSAWSLTESGGSAHTVGSGGVVSDGGGGKVEVSAVSVKVNDGAMEVT